MKKAADGLLASPAWKTVFNVVIPILAGIFSGSLVTEITVDGKLEWGRFYQTKSFYVLLVLTAVIYFYNRFLYRRDVEVSKFSDVEFCVAYMRSKCLPEAAERYRELIREGHGGELLQIMNEIKRSLE